MFKSILSGVQEIWLAILILNVAFHGWSDGLRSIGLIWLNDEYSRRDLVKIPWRLSIPSVHHGNHYD